jgi:hypothetical protein
LAIDLFIENLNKLKSHMEWLCYLNSHPPKQSD